MKIPFKREEPHWVGLLSTEAMFSFRGWWYEGQTTKFLLTSMWLLPTLFHRICPHKKWTQMSSLPNGHMSILSLSFLIFLQLSVQLITLVPIFPWLKIFSSYLFNHSFKISSDTFFSPFGFPSAMVFAPCSSISTHCYAIKSHCFQYHICAYKT